MAQLRAEPRTLCWLAFWLLLMRASGTNAASERARGVRRARRLAPTAASCAAALAALHSCPSYATPFPVFGNYCDFDIPLESTEVLVI